MMTTGANVNDLNKSRRPPASVRWRGVGALLVLIAGAVGAAWLGQEAGRYIRFESGDLRPVVAPHLHLSGPTYLETDKSQA